MRKTKLIFIATLIIGLIGIVLAFWASSVFVNSDDANILIQVGSAEPVESSLIISGDDANNLVPIGALGNSPAGSVEFVVIPIDILWREDNTNLATGLTGLFTISPTVIIKHNVTPVNLVLYDEAISLVKVYFMLDEDIAESDIKTKLDAQVGTDANVFYDELSDLDDSITTDEFEIELTLGTQRTVYLVAFIEMPDIDTFLYISESIIEVKLNIKANDGQVHPVPIIPRTQVRFDYITAGQGHVLAIDTNGYLWAWGLNDKGQVGDGTSGTNNYVTLPYKITALNGIKIKRVAAGRYHSLALDYDGNLYTWGSNNFGEAANGGYSVQHLVPTMVLSNTNYVSIHGGDYTSFAIDNDGDIWGWGQNDSSQLGIIVPATETTKHRFAPTNITSSIEVGFVDVSAGGNHAIALDESGKLWAWGYCTSGSHGMGFASMTQITTPDRIPSVINTSFKAIITTYDFSGTIDLDGYLWTWGANGYYQLGDNSATNKSSPHIIPNMPADLFFDYIIINYAYYGLAIDHDGNLWCWGNDAYGNFGDDSTVTWRVPGLDKAVDIDIKMVIIAYYATIILATDGQIWVAGNNGYGQFGDGTRDSLGHFDLQPKIIE